MRHKVFVYGTLRKNRGNHGHLTGSTYLGEATVDGYDMYDLGYFPAACIGTKKVHGEVYEISDKTFQRLDLLEGYPKYYTRIKETTLGGDLVWIYLQTRQKIGDDSRLVEGGDWGAYRDSQGHALFH